MLQGWSWPRPTRILKPSVFTALKWPNSLWSSGNAEFLLSCIYTRIMLGTNPLLHWALCILNIYVELYVLSLYSLSSYYIYGEREYMHTHTYDTYGALMGYRLLPQWPLMHWMKIKINCHFSYISNRTQLLVSLDMDPITKINIWSFTNRMMLWGELMGWQMMR